jgi:hypothetical protein
MPNEADRKLNLVKGVKALGGFARRLEDKYALGLLDLVIKLPGHNVVMAEGKLIEGHAFAPTPRQYIEGLDWLRVSVDVLLIGWHGKNMYIAPWVKKADKRDCWTKPIGDAEALLQYLGELNAKETEHQDRVRA